MENDFGKSSILSGNLLTNAYFYVLFTGFNFDLFKNIKNTLEIGF